MVIVTAGNHRFHMDGYLKANLDHSINEVKKRDFDRLILVFGRERFGKTTIATQMAVYCDPTFDLSRVCFTPEQFLMAVETADKFQSIVFDETMWGLSSRSAMTKINRYLIKIISEMGSKNLFVFMCIPSIFIMDWYIAVHRSNAGIYVYDRAKFGSYDYPTKKKLYLEGKKTHSYNVSPNFIGRFIKYFPLDREKYEAKKQEAINLWARESRQEVLWKQQRDKLIKIILEKNLMKKEEIAEALDLSLLQVNNLINKSAGIM
jgi:hypothetical protein